MPPWLGGHPSDSALPHFGPFERVGLVTWAATGLCLHRRPEPIHYEGIETAQHIYQHTCHNCQRPALTFDRDDATLCGDHAQTFIAAPRVEIEEDDLW
jgi:hypothetical protein